MGNESSQLEKTGEVQYRDGRLIGPAMSPTPSVDAMSDTGRIIGPSMSPLPSDGEARHQQVVTSPKSSKKKKKGQRKSNDALTSPDPRSTQSSALPNDDDERSVLPGSTRKASEKRKRKKKEHKFDDEHEHDEVIIESTQPEPPSSYLDETLQSVKRKSRRRSKLPVPSYDNPQEQELVNGETTTNEEEDNTQVDGLQSQDALLDHESHQQEEPEIMQSPRSTRKRRTRKKRDSPNSPEASLLVSDAMGGSTASAQQPTVNGLLKYEPDSDVDVKEDVIPSSEPNERRRGSTASQASETSSRQTETEEPADNEDDSNEEEEPPQVQLAGNSVSDRDDVTRHSSTGSIPEHGPSQEEITQDDSLWLHKREMNFSDEEPISDTRTSQEREDDAALPNLQPVRIKTEPPASASGSDSESASPSAARLERLERSRSRSMSRASATRLADEDLGLDVRYSRGRLPSGPSSTGSNVSIPAQIENEESRPVSRASTRSRSSTSSRNNAQPNGDIMDVDQPVTNGSPPKKPPKRAKMTRKVAVMPEVYDEMNIDDNNDNGDVHPIESPTKTSEDLRRQSDDGMSDRNRHLMADWLSQSQEQGSHPAGVEEADHNGGAEGVDLENVVGDAAVPQDTAEPDVPQLAPDHVSTQETTGQPKKQKKKRRLQPKMSLSLSQLEADDVDGEGEGQSRLPSLSQRSKLKDDMRGGSNEPEESEIGEVRVPAGRGSAIPQPQPQLPEKHKKAGDAPLPKPKKAKRKRQSAASEDELEKLMARNASKSLGLSDDEKVRSAKRKRLSNGQKADGRWTDEELGAIDKVVSDFCGAHDMTQHEINAMIHERPDKANTLHQEFWSKAVSAISRRTRKQIVERVRRRYNNFVGRGAWTDEEKEELHELFGKHGKKFADIAGMINRDQKDVRDYWRNQYLVHETQVKTRWTKEETDRLKEVVEEALNNIRIMRENNDQFRPRPRTNGFDDEALLDWEHISAAMGLTRSRQQCKWKWTDMKEKGVTREDTSLLPKKDSERPISGISEELANAREDYRGMSTEDKLRLVDAIHDCGASEDGRIRWNSLVNERFRTKWHRPTLKLVWYRLRQAVPNYAEQDVQSNARYLLNHYNTRQSLPEVGDNQVDEQAEERVISHKPGSRIWKKVSDEPRAVRERQRRSSSVSSRASSRPARLISSQILRIAGSDDENDNANRTRGQRSDSVDLGLEEGKERGRRSAGRQSASKKGKARGGGRRSQDDAVPIRIPTHLKGEAAKEALEQARARAGHGKGSMRGVRSASVAVDSESE